MAQIIKPLKIDLEQETSYVYMKVKQYDDNSRKYQVIFTNRGIPQKLIGNELITLYLSESGHADAYASSDCTWENGYPYITFTSNMLSKIGDIDCNFVIYSATDHSLISSRLWHINVQRSFINYEGLIKSEEFNILNNLVEQALLIPELIAKFNLSQEEANSLIEKLKNNIKNYDNQFSAIKDMWTSEFQNILQQINDDISSYQNDYNLLKEQIISLKTNITSWYTTAQEAENDRVSAENQRQTDTAKAIKNCNDATSSANTVISNAEKAIADANAATQEALDQAAIAATEAANAKKAVDDLHFEIVSCDGGNASSVYT